MRTAVTACLLAFSAFAHAVRYHVYDLGVIPREQNSVAYGLNDDGLVVGRSNNASGRAFGWTEQTGLRELFPRWSFQYQGEAEKVNSHGDILGTLDVYDPGLRRSVKRAFTAKFGQGYRQIGAPAGFEETYGNGINDAGQIVGYAQARGQQAFRYTPGSGFQMLGFLPGGDGSRALGINTGGDLVGWSSVPLGQFGHMHPFVWTPQTGMFDPGMLYDYTDGYAADINDHGTAVIRYYTFGQVDRVALWTPLGGLFDIGVPSNSAGAFPFAINNLDQVAGFVSYQTNAAFVFSVQTGFVVLNEVLDAESQGWDLRVAYDINDRGEVCGGGFHNGRPRAFFAKPVQ